MSSADTPQLSLWRGSFGDQYLSRNAPNAELLAMLTRMWAKPFQSLQGRMPKRILEVGANLGLNLRAMRGLTGSEFYAAEPNATARSILVNDGVVAEANLFDAYAANLPLADGAVDFAFTSGVLIHIAPEDLLASVKEIHRVSSDWIMCSEYFSDTPEHVPYRGQDGYMFRRDFGKFYMDNFDDIELVDYGFFWKEAACVDNMNWWLFRKRR